MFVCAQGHWVLLWLLDTAESQVSAAIAVLTFAIKSHFLDPWKQSQNAGPWLCRALPLLPINPAVGCGV